MTKALPELRPGPGVIIRREVVDGAAGLVKYTAALGGYDGWLIGSVNQAREPEVIAVCEGFRARIEADDLSVFDTMLPVLTEADAEPVEAVWPPVPLCATCGMHCWGGRPCTLCAKWRVPGTKALWQEMSV